MDEDIKKLLEENLKLIQETHQMVKSIKKYIFMQSVWGFLKILIIVVPIILGFIYLSPLLKDAFKQYQNILGLQGAINLDSLGDENLSNMLKNGSVPTKIPTELEKYLR